MLAAAVRIADPDDLSPFTSHLLFSCFLPTSDYSFSRPVQSPVAEGGLSLDHLMNLRFAFIDDRRPSISEITANRRFGVRKPFVTVNLQGIIAAAKADS